MLCTISTASDRQDWDLDPPRLPSGKAIIAELVSAIRLPRSGMNRGERFVEAHLRRALAFCVGVTDEGALLGEGNKGGLALWQLERATEVLEAHIGHHICLSAVARECGLTASYFARAFKASTGLAPSQWLVNRRIAMAKTLLSTTPKMLSEIALDCGFTDQSHFTRVFAQRVGVSPGRWRATAAAPSRERPTWTPQVRLPSARLGAGER